MQQRQLKIIYWDPFDTENYDADNFP